MSEYEDLLRKHDAWLREYQPLKKAEAFESGLPLDRFTQLSEGLIVVGSGSPRNRRYREALKGRPIAQLTISDIAKLFSQMDIAYEFRDSVERILQYDEPRRAWNNGADSNISLNKARLTAAAVLIHAISDGQDIPPFKVLGRDYNIADVNGKFTDRPGYAMPNYVPKEILPQGWTTKSSDPDPESPPNQCHRLYKEGSHFLAANSTSILTVDHRMATPAVIDHLTDLSIPPDGLPYSTALTFMGLKPGETNSEIGFKIHALIGYLSDFGLGYGGEQLYAVPGVIDWSRPPFREQLLVWISSHEEAVYKNFTDIQNDIQQAQGSWHRFQDIAAKNKFIEDELVGASTYSLQDMQLS